MLSSQTCLLEAQDPAVGLTQGCCSREWAEGRLLGLRRNRLRITSFASCDTVPHTSSLNVQHPCHMPLSVIADALNKLDRAAVAATLLDII